jgi:hypothetical protein
MYCIAIPSYQRSKILRDRTLNILKKHKISKSKIYVFVANEEQKIEYKTIIGDSYHIIVGKKGLKNQRNFIQDYFPANSLIVQMDDDLKEIYQLVMKKNSNKYKQKDMKPITNLKKFIENAFQYTIQQGYYLWGVYPIDNAYFMSNKTTHDLRLIVGPFWGYINRHNNRLKNTINEKEDIERTIKYYIKDGGVVRFNNISIQTSYYKTPGGMGTLKNRVENATKSVEFLVNKYPKYCKANLNKKSGMPDIKLIKQ